MEAGGVIAAARQRGEHAGEGASIAGGMLEELLDGGVEAAAQKAGQLAVVSEAQAAHFEAQLDMSDVLGRETVDAAAALKVFERAQAARTALERSILTMRIRIKNTMAREQQVKLEEIAERLRPERNLKRPNPVRPGIQSPFSPAPAT